MKTKVKSQLGKPMKEITNAVNKSGSSGLVILVEPTKDESIQQKAIIGDGLMIRDLLLDLYERDNNFKLILNSVYGEILNKEKKKKEEKDTTASKKR